MAGSSYLMIIDQSAHLDWDWLVPFSTYFQEGYPPGSAVNDILTSVFKLLGENPNFHYSLCEIGYLKKYVEYQTSIGNNPLAKISEPREISSNFHIVGGGIVSPDNLLSAGEAFIRNYLCGKLYLNSVLPHLLPLRHCWIPDDFGHDPELPVVIQAMGMTSVAFWRIPGSMVWNYPSSLPNDLLTNGLDFIWKSNDGSQAIAHWLQGGYGQASSLTCPEDNYAIQGYLASYQVDGITSPPCRHTKEGITSPPCRHTKEGITSPPCPPCRYTEEGITSPYSGAGKLPYLYIPMAKDFSMPLVDGLGNPGLVEVVDSWNQQPPVSNVTLMAGSFDDFITNIMPYKDELPIRVEFNATPYWTGYYMSRPFIKIMHYQVTRMLLVAEIIGVLSNLSSDFWTQMQQAWLDFIPSTHHDFITGTAVDDVYLGEQTPLLNNSCQTADTLVSQGMIALIKSIKTLPREGEIPVVIVNPTGSPFTGFTTLVSPIPSGINGIRYEEKVHPIQITSDGSVGFRVKGVPSLGYITGYLTSEKPTISSKVSISPLQSGANSYTLSNEYISVVISATANWGIESITDAKSNRLLTNGFSNQLVFYSDGGGIYQFGNEYNPEWQSENVKITWELTPFTYTTNPGIVLESGPADEGSTDAGPANAGASCGELSAPKGPLRVMLSTTITTNVGQSYQFIYSLTMGEPFLRITTTGSAPSGYSVMTRFSLAKTITQIVHGTPNHWTSVQPEPLYPPPVFRATHHFVLPQDKNGDTLGAIYHSEVPAWAIDDNGDLLGCLYRNTPGGDPPHGASGSDDGTWTLHYAFRVPSGLGDPTTCQPLIESIQYTQSPLVGIISNTSETIPDNKSIAQINGGNGVILVAKRGDFNPDATILRVYQPTNTSQILGITLGSPSNNIVPVTALEDPLDTSIVGLTEKGFTLQTSVALNTVQIT